MHPPGCRYDSTVTLRQRPRFRETTQFGISTSWVILPIGEKAVLIDVRGSSRPRWQIQLYQDIAHVTVYGPFTDRELERDRPIGFPFRNQLDHLQLARGQDAGTGIVV